METEQNQVLILDSIGDAQSRGRGWCKEIQKRKLEGEKQKCNGIRVCGLKSNCLLLDLNSPPLPLADRMRPDISILALSGLWPEGWNICQLPFLPLTFPPSIFPSFFCFSHLLPLNQPVVLFSRSSSSSSSFSDPPSLPPHLFVPRLIVGCYWASRGKPTKQRRWCGGYLLPYPPPVSRAAMSPRCPSLLSTSCCIYVIPLMVLDSGVWAVCALRCEKQKRNILSTVVLCIDRNRRLHYSLLQPTQSKFLPDVNPWFRVHKWL